jgi:hypothetical protein
MPHQLRSDRRPPRSRYHRNNTQPRLWRALVLSRRQELRLPGVPVFDMLPRLGVAGNPGFLATLGAALALDCDVTPAPLTAEVASQGDSRARSAAKSGRHSGLRACRENHTLALPCTESLTTHQEGVLL